MSRARARQLVIDSETEPAWDDYGPSVRKIVVGSLLPREERFRIERFPRDLAVRFPGLTHLYLWNINGPEELPALPPGVECLDVRGCPSLARSTLPTNLDTLVLEACPNLRLEPPATAERWERLIDLSIQGSLEVKERWLAAVLRHAPKLEKLDASQCPQIKSIAQWPPALRDVRLDGCTGLERLPAHWPATLRRIGLRGATALRALPDDFDQIDYIDLAYTTSLEALPTRRGRPRTLMLFESAVREPPAHQHGTHQYDNVAAETEAYFNDVALTGKGEVRRCKLLLLGNGGAGKTSLALALVPGHDPSEVEQIGSTHGVQFWDWPSDDAVGRRMARVDRHVWDFGGQEIYHNTHRLFMSKGAVFLLVWKPEQDAGQPPPSPSGYQDEWRPLQYWIDFIHLACPWRPRIAIVCSHHAEPTPALEEQWKRAVRPEFHSLPCFYVDSQARAGQLDLLEDWLQKAVGDVVHAQGVAVPTYWEIAQDMVHGWITSLRKEMSPEHFRAALQTAIETAATTGYPTLRDSLAEGRFVLTDERLRRTLAYLTRSGSLFWDPGLFEGRVIVDQTWALTGLYAVLDRARKDSIYRELTRSDGRFTRTDLDRWAWGAKGYSEADQRLLLSFMQQCGLCFLLRRGADTWSGEDVYVSFEHLPTAKELRLQREIDGRASPADPPPRTWQNHGVHEQHWQRFLVDAGAHYGAGAQYAVDAFYLVGKDGQRVMVTCHLDPSGLGADLQVQVAGGEDPAGRLRAVTEHLTSFLPGDEARPRARVHTAVGEAPPVREVFLSYAWEPSSETQGEGRIPAGYEAPVDAIEAFLRSRSVRVIRDKHAMRFGDRLDVFMKSAGQCSHVVMVHSDKYWRSPYCMFELWTVTEGLKHKPQTLRDVVIPVEHLGSGISQRETRDGYAEYWRTFTGTPTLLGWSLDELRLRAGHVVYSMTTDLAGMLDLDLHWSRGAGHVLAEIAKRLKL